MKKLSLRKGKCLRVLVPSLAEIQNAYGYMFYEYFPSHPEQPVDINGDTFELYGKDFLSKENSFYIYFYLK